MTHSPEKPKIFYGYWIVLAAFYCVLIYSGCGYTFSLFVKPLQADFGWGRGGIMAAFTILYLVVGATAPYFGKLIDRYGVRKVISIGAFVGGLGFILLSLVNNLWYFYIGYIIVGVGIGATSLVPATVLVSNWFKKHRGTAIGIMSTGVGVGGFALTPFIGGYLIPNFGWRVSYLALALLTWAIIPLAILVIRTKPADMGLFPDGRQVPETMAEAKASLSVAKGLSLRNALATLGFWLIAVSFLTSSFSQIGIIQSQVPYLIDIGFPAATAATALGGVGLASAIGKFGFGWLCDRIPAKYACSIGLVLQSIGIVLLLSAGPASPLAIIYLYVIIFGLGMGSWVPAMSMLVSTNFGLISYGTIFGMINLMQSVGAATGPLAAGFLYDMMNTYYGAFLIFLMLYAVSIPAVLLVCRPNHGKN